MLATSDLTGVCETHFTHLTAARIAYNIPIHCNGKGMFQTVHKTEADSILKVTV